LEAGRVRGPLDVHRELLGASVEHEVVRLPRLVSTASELPEALGLSPRVCVRMTLFEAPAGLVGCALACDRTPDPTVVAHALGARSVRRAADDAVNAAVDTAAGLVCPIGLPAGVPLLVDAGLAGADVVYAATGDAGTALKIRAADLIRHTGARVLDLAHPRIDDRLDPLRGAARATAVASQPVR
jgi:prolyl-tRNA editing enzyme YbaK/EbsC (Cys-tRNA(Pro) deacylase)